MKYATYILVILLAAALWACGKEKAEETTPLPKSQLDTLAQQTSVSLPETVRPQQSGQPKKQQPAPVAADLERKTVSADELPSLIDAHRDRLQRIFREQSKLIDMSGGVSFTVHVNSSGLVEKVDVKPDADAKFTTAFLDAAMTDIGAWNLPVDEATSHTFRMVFMK